MKFSMTKTVLVYGDSNTYGQTNWPILSERRLPFDQRWTTLVEKKSQAQFRVVAEALGGRTAGNVQRGNDEHRNGKRYFETIYRSNFPVDFIIIALGVNDMKLEYGRSAEEIVRDLLWYQEVVFGIDKLPSESYPKVIYLTPQNIDDPSRDSDNKYLAGQANLRNDIVRRMKNDDRIKCIEIDKIATNQDGLHWSPAGHEKVSDEVLKMLMKEEL